MIRFLSKADSKRLKGAALVRLDFNTEDDWRIKAAIPTLKFLLRSASKIVVIGHKGRPAPATVKNGKLVRFDRALSLRRDAAEVRRELGRDIRFIPHFDFKKIKEEIAAAPRKSIFVLENMRFLKGESTPRPELAKKLASLADYYVNDAFAVSHRSDDSVAKVERFLPSYGGLELERELKSLSHVLDAPKRPLVVILGGGKASDKLGIIKNLRRKADVFLLGGAIANTLLFLSGMNVKDSVRDSNAKDLKNDKPMLGYRNIRLPKDFVWSGRKIFDIGTTTAEAYEKEIANAKTVLWNGPVGLFEKKPYDRGTLALARAIVKNKKAYTLAGGGETVMFLKKHKLDKKFSFISTGGGAMLEFLAGEKLPGIEALKYGKR